MVSEVSVIESVVDTAPSAAVGTSLAERSRVRFFRVFFGILLLVMTMSEWVVVVRVLARLGVDLPPLSHPLGVVGFYVLNRVLVRRFKPRGPGPLVAGYSAFAFTAIFGAFFVGAAELVWALVRVGTSPAVRRAGIVPALDPATWQPIFDAGVDVGLAAIAGLFAFGYTAGRRALAVTELQVAIPALPPALAGFRIVHLSDLHMGVFLRVEELAEHVARVNALAPDLVCITGDLVDRASTCAEALPVLAGLRARHGVVVTLGNHDMAAGAEAVTRALRSLTPFTVLRNGRVEIEHDGVRLVVVGVDDLGRDWARGVLEHPALPPLVRDLAPGTPLVVLTHRPDCFDQAAALGAHLVLAGHTHGGQIGLPSLGGRRVRNIAETITRYDRGVFRRGAATLVVSNGLGFTGQPVRLFTPREIGVLELTPSA